MTERNPDLEAATPEIPGYRGRVYYFGEEKIPIHLDEHVWQFDTEDGKREIPVLSIWNYKNHEKIAKAIISGKRVAIYMWGTFGTGYLLNFEEWQEKDTDEAKGLREKLKIGRPEDKSFPILVHPDDEAIFWDFDQLHPSLQHLKNAEERYKLYQSGPAHLIPPVKQNYPLLDDSLRWPYDNTACFYYMPHPGWERTIGIMRKEVKHAVFGGGSLNPHQKEPVFRASDLYTRINNTPQWIEGVDLVVICEISEHTQTFRQQTQIRLAQKSSDGVSELIRRGSMSEKRWSIEQGIPVKAAEKGVEEPQASSLWPYTEEANSEVDLRVQRGIKLMKLYDREAAKRA
ncbi:hypothetical protein HY382_02760 [Candidatus Curtissbacteria bacterium]|nr:hypothetical protein [Candidatus Curtissbacteria bacterium]